MKINILILLTYWWIAVSFILFLITALLYNKKNLLLHWALWLLFPLHLMAYFWLFIFTVIGTFYNNKMMLFYLNGLLLSFKQLLENLLTKNNN
jgi:hypothetical protein